MRKLLLEHRRAPGDVVVMTALVRDLMLAYPGQFVIDTASHAGDVWQNNPYLTKLTTDKEDVEHYRVNYGDALTVVGSTNRHFLLGFHSDFERQTGIQVPLHYPRPDLHLSEEEKTSPLVSGRYWVTLAGGKSDFFTKHWIYKRHQQVVNIGRGFGLRFVQVGALGKGSNGIYHFHPRLENCLNLTGLTDMRDLIRLIYHAEGVVCGITAAMHIAAALEKPCVVVAGGREEWWWAGYVKGRGNFGNQLREDVRVPHRFLHTIGQLPCCQRRGCWANTIVDGNRPCRYPLAVEEQLAPKCMDMITVEHVLEAMMSYYTDGTLPPISQPKRIGWKDGKPILLGPLDPEPEPPPSALVQALTLPEPVFLQVTRAINKAQQKVIIR
jgi:ADP-heptose:LPS heptosyltransferase